MAIRSRKFKDREYNGYCLSLDLRLLNAITLSVLKITAYDGHYGVCP
jgi:hypothetical protein